MAMPNSGDEDSDAREGSYTVQQESDSISARGGKRGSIFQNESGYTSSAGKQSEILGKVTRFRDYLASKGVPLIGRIPPNVLLIIAIVLLILFLVIISFIIILALLSRSSDPLLISVQRTHGIWPAESDEYFISANSLIPPTISICTGFGFSCTESPGTVIGSLQRCDGVKDCADGSDEIGCRACRTSFGCPTVFFGRNATHLMCLRGSSLCDGKSDCPDKSDETKFCRSSCKKGEFACRGGRMCIPEKFVCDGDTHCKNGDDERNCNGKCRGGAVWCSHSKRCIPIWQRCDGVKNCRDGSDEKNCKCKECSGQDTALCKNSKICIDRKKTCDGNIDCPGSDDEKECPGSCLIKKDSSFVECKDGRHYHKKFACSGALSICQGVCKQCDSEMAFTCANRKCVPRAMVCDGLDDCGDNSDEANCDCAAMKAKGSVIQCKSPSRRSSSKCISASKRCDGYADCPDGEDEKGCDGCRNNKEAFYCSRDRKCIPSTLRCNGNADCSDGSDEEKCSCEECSRQPHPMYKCSAAAKCFPYEMVCNPRTRCPSPTARDKLFCANRARLSKQTNS